MKAIILAAGIGSRLGKIRPKSLTMLPSGETIIENQIKILRNCGIKEILIVVGFKKELVMEEYPSVLYSYNPLFHISNTSKSLLHALKSIDLDDVIWLNGDVFLDKLVITRICTQQGNAVAVKKKSCGEEEVKYRTNRQNHICEISKKIRYPEGEAVGVNKILKSDFNLFLNCLEECEDQDYFEKAIEKAISMNAVFYPIDVSDCNCVEVDFKKDLEEIQKISEIDNTDRLETMDGGFTR